MTLAVFLPLVVVIAVAQRASAALGRYRAASSQATSQVTGAIGDMLAAVRDGAGRRRRGADHGPLPPAQRASDRR